MRWITREPVKVDRVACPWLIKKFVDPEAEFLCILAEKVVSETKKATFGVGVAFLELREGDRGKGTPNGGSIY